MTTDKKSLIRIGVFYDGNYFLHVSNYYNYFHQRRKRLNIAGLHEFIRTIVARELETTLPFCKIIDAHYFRGRISAQEASQRGNQLYNDRVFDDILMSEGIVTHYMPIRNRSGKREEKGVDVWLALEAYEQTISKQFDMLVLITSDGDYVPLIRKINSLGTKVMVLCWDFEYTDDTGREVVTRTSQDLLQEASFPVAMHEIINNNSKANASLVNTLFATHEYTPPKHFTSMEAKGTVLEGYAMNMNNGYGFIQYPPNNLFFHYQDVLDGDFNEIANGDLVEFTIDVNERGQEVAKNVRKVGIADPNVF